MMLTLPLNVHKSKPKSKEITQSNMRPFLGFYAERTRMTKHKIEERVRISIEEFIIVQSTINRSICFNKK